MTVLGREAVVIIHGIGEQAPLSTVRAFVGRRTVTSRGQEARGGVVEPTDVVFTEPSPAATRTDDLTYVVAWDQSVLARGILDERPGWGLHERTAVTEFHEFYWAPRYRSTTTGHLTGWLVPLVLRRLSTFTTPRLRGPSGVVRAVPAIVLLAAIAAALAYRAGVFPLWATLTAMGVAVVLALLVGTFLGLIAVVKVVALCVGALVAVACLVWGLDTVTSVLGAVGTSALVAALGGFLAVRTTRTLGDAARYLGGTQPGNVEENEVIRERVLDLLARLHEARDPDTGRYRYDRIVVVGHSLGSVIAYDAVRLLWSRWSRSLVLPSHAAGTVAAEAVNAVETAGQALRTAASPTELDAAREAYWAAQRGAQLVLRDLPEAAGARRWIVTDLVTLGSPLTYADAFLATGPEDLADRFEERSLAAVPPTVQRVRRAAGHPYRLWVPGPEGGTTRWHHAAPFACVRWTNLWFEHDIVGGPVAPHFGPGVRDVSLGGTRWLAGMAFAYPHSSYWTTSRRSLVREGSERSRAILRSLVRRRPTLLLTARADLDDDALRGLAEVLVDPAGQEGSAVDVRLYVGATDPERRGAYLPVDRAPLPEAARRRELRELLGAGSRTAFLVSVDLLAPPRERTTSAAELGEPDESEPVEEPDVIGEAEEPEVVGEDEAVDEELEVVGEEE